MKIVFVSWPLGYCILRLCGSLSEGGLLVSAEYGGLGPHQGGGFAGWAGPVGRLGAVVCWTFDGHKGAVKMLHCVVRCNALILE